MATRTYTETSCDSPICQLDRVINTETDYVNAMVYGATFHITCFLALTPLELCKALGLDEVEVQHIAPDGTVFDRGRVWSALS